MNNALQELRQLRQWVAWRLEWDKKNERKTKPPYNIHSDRRGDKTNPDDWASYDEVIDYAMRKGLIQSKSGGAGFVFTQNDPYAGIDLDYVFDNDGKLIQEAADIVALMDSYTEYSPSGKGLHILFKLNQPLNTFFSKHKLDLAVNSRFEIYDAAWYFTVSNRPYGEVKPIAERTEQCRQICAKLSAQTQQPQALASPAKKNTIVDWKYNPDNYTPFSVDTRTELSDDELLQKMFASAHGTEIKALFYGDTSCYGHDASRADLALCSYLNFWTDGNPYRIDTLFRQSALMRTKWDEPHSSNGDTYGKITINRAINGEGSSYSGNITSQPSSNSQNSTDNQHEAQSLPQEEGHFSAYLSRLFYNDIQAFALFKNRKSGFSNFDRFNTLYPGLYILGGVSGCGKTTFLHQISDYLAANGEYVLFFSLEQPEFELASKGLARITALDNPTLAKTALEIRNGNLTDAVQRAIRTYQSYGDHIYIIEGGFDFSVDSLIATVKHFIEATGIRPVVCLDYLQILRPSKAFEHTAYREAIDDSIHALKKLQVDYGLLMFVISSFNRGNYSTSADFSAFKESGLIEYSADVVLALQLLAMHADLLDTNNRLMAKRDFLNSEKKRDLRDVELVTLKNRYGKAFARYFFLYDAAHDLFTPNDISEEQADALINERAKPFEKKHSKSGYDNFSDDSDCKGNNVKGL